MYNNIIVPLDGSELAEAVLPHVTAMVEACHPATVTFVRVTERLDPLLAGESSFNKDQIRDLEEKFYLAAEKYLKQLVERMKYAGVKVKWQVLAGNSAEMIVDYVHKNGGDLIIVATHGRSGVSRWVWGSTADRILRLSCAPVLMVRVPGCINIH